MARFERWDVVAVPFPYVERPVRQRRPAVIVAVITEAPHDLLWVLMITAAANPPWPDDVPVNPASGTGLPIASVVRTAKIATIAAADARRIGRLPAAVLSAVAAVLGRRLTKD